MRLSTIIVAVVLRIFPNPEPPNRPMSTPEDVIWKRREFDAIKRDAQLMGIDVDLERAGRE